MRVEGTPSRSSLQCHTGSFTSYFIAPTRQRVDGLPRSGLNPLNESVRGETRVSPWACLRGGSQ